MSYKYFCIREKWGKSDLMSVLFIYLFIRGKQTSLNCIQFTCEDLLPNIYGMNPCLILLSFHFHICLTIKCVIECAFYFIFLEVSTQVLTSIYVLQSKPR